LPENKLENDLNLLIDAVKAAGKVALRTRAKGLTHQRKKDGSIVTNGDLAVDASLREALLGARPTYGWFSEEGTDPNERKRRAQCWIADPIDGTRHYHEGRDQWCVGVGLLHEGECVAGALFLPVQGILYHAAKGHGAFRDGDKISVRSNSGSVDVMGSKADVGGFADATRVSRQDLPFLLRLAQVAEGRIDAVVSSTRKHDWDLAPGVLMITEAGGIATDFTGVALSFNEAAGSQNGIIAGSREAHHSLVTTRKAA
jgi:myo-inositol-1(or 4)-monophosphatase